MTDYAATLASEMTTSVTCSYLKRSPSEGVRFNYILIDPALFDGILSPWILTSLASIEKSNRSLSRQHATTRPTLKEELEDVCLFFYGTDPRRASHLKVIAEFMVYPGDNLGRYFVFEWGLALGTL